MNKPSLVTRAEQRLRRKRFAFLEALLKPLARPVRILDVGGAMGFWQNLDYGRLGPVHITLLNVFEQANLPPAFTSRVGDARSLKNCSPGDYDVVVSNSVIGHVGSFADQTRMADEIQRIGRRYFVQTPNHYFPLDWRTLIPFFQLLPARQQAWWVHHCAITSFGRISPYSKALAWVACVRNLTHSELKTLFPEARIAREKVLGLTKSFMVFKGFDG